MTKENLTEIVAIVDKSSSMRPLTKETIQGFNSFLAEQKKLPGEALFTLATFSSPESYHLVYDAVPISTVPDLDNKSYDPDGWTALLDAVGKTVNGVGIRLARMKEEERPSKVLVLIMTDGEENYSREFKHSHIMEMIKHQREKYSWEFVFIGANIDAIEVAATIGVDAGHSYNYVASAAGSAQLFDSVTRGVSSYRNAVGNASFKMADPIQGLNNNPVQNNAVVTNNVVNPFTQGHNPLDVNWLISDPNKNILGNVPVVTDSDSSKKDK